MYGSVDEPDAVMEVITVRESLHEHVRSVRAVFPGADVLYRDNGREALILTGGYVVSVRDDGSTSSADVGEWSTGYDA